MNKDEELFDLDEMRALVAVAEEGRFDRAAARLGVAQPVVGRQVSRLEKRLGRTLFQRAAVRASLTADGEAMLAYARAMLNVASRTQAYLDNQALSGVVRFGLVEDFALIGLTPVLAALRQHHPQLHLFTEVGLCDDLFAALDAGQLDVVLAKRPLGSTRGVLLWQERLAWVGLPEVLDATQDGPVPLALYPPRTASRDAVERALRDTGRTWTVVFESASIASLRAAVRAGVGLSAFGRNLLPGDVKPLDHGGRLPALGMTEYVLDQRADASASVRGFADILHGAASAAAGETGESRTGPP